MKIRRARRIPKVYIQMVFGVGSLLVLSVGAATLLFEHLERNTIAPLEMSREPAAANELPFEGRGELTPEDARNRTGIEAKKARLVVFRPNSFVVDSRTKSGSRHWNNPERIVSFNLFEDEPSVFLRLQRPSNYGVNYEQYAGVVDGDPKSRVQLQVAGRILDGTIETSNRKFRIVDAGGGLHIVIETVK